jgi:hypothetical protein
LYRRAVGFARRPWATAATVCTIAAAITYLILIVRQSPGGSIDDPARVAVVTVLLIGLASLAALGTLAASARVRRNSLIAAAIGLSVLGVVALWSIGMLLLLAALFAALGLVRRTAA